MAGQPGKEASCFIRGDVGHGCGRIGNADDLAFYYAFNMEVQTAREVVMPEHDWKTHSTDRKGGVLKEHSLGEAFSFSIPEGALWTHLYGVVKGIEVSFRM